MNWKEAAVWIVLTLCATAFLTIRGCGGCGGGSDLRRCIDSCTVDATRPQCIEACGNACRKWETP